MQTPWATVVGEVEDVKEGAPDQPAKQQYYGTVAQGKDMGGTLSPPDSVNGNGGYIALRTAMPPEQMEHALRATVRSIDAQLPLDQVQTMEHAISESEAPRRFNTALISSFAAIAVLLAVLGIYSVIAFSVALRVQEMAIRLALGSQRVGIVRLVVASGVKLALAGCAIGLVVLGRIACAPEFSIWRARVRSYSAGAGCGRAGGIDGPCLAVAGPPRCIRRTGRGAADGVT